MIVYIHLLSLVLPLVCNFPGRASHLVTACPGLRSVDLGSWLMLVPPIDEDGIGRED